MSARSRVNVDPSPLVADYHDFIDEKFKGIHISSETYDLIKEEAQSM